MTLVFAGIAAHTPVLIPTVGKDGLKLLEKTREAMDKLEQELYIAHPDIMIVVSPHGEALPDAITINMNSKYRSRFDEFGDLVTKLVWKPATMLIDRFREDFKRYDLPLVLVSDEYLDYGVSVPLLYLTRHLPDIKIVPIRTSSGLDIKTHFEFGKCLRNEISKSTARIAFISSSDLSHRVGENSPAGFSPRGVAYDDKVQEIIRNKNPMGYLDIDTAWGMEAGACGMNSLAMLFGLLDGIKHEPEVLSYERPFGVGYLLVSMRIA